ncbi:MAG: PD-(D/E)XK nuclease family protein [Candidatus Aminicenantes bacterium]
MIDYLARLKKIIRDHPLEEKIFVVSSYNEGRQIGEYLTLQDCSWVNLRYTTPLALAHSVVSLELTGSGRRVIPVTAQLFLLESIFSSLKKQENESYFTGLESRAGIIRSLHRSISELRLEGFTAEDMSADQFEYEVKGRDLIWMMQRYEEEMDKGKWLDQAGMFRLASEKSTGANHTLRRLVMCFRNLALEKLPRRFLESYSGGEIIWLTRASVFGLTPPRRRLISKPVPPAKGSKSKKANDSASPAETAWLFDPAEAPSPEENEALEIFSAVGAVNECRGILRRMHRDKLQADNVEVLYPPGSVYASYLHSLCRRTGVPVTFAEGPGVGWTSPGKLFLGLLDWMEHGYQVKTVCRLIENRVLSLGENHSELTSESARMILQKAKICWGRDRYLERLKRFEQALKEKDPEDKESRRKIKQSILMTTALIRIFERIFSHLPVFPQDGLISLPEFCGSLMNVLQEFAVINNPRDAEAVRIFRRKLEEATLIDLKSNEPEVILDWLRDAVSHVKIGAAGPKPGHLHAAPYSCGGFSGRKVTFVCGLDQGRFPGAPQEDPVLLDGERRSISENLPVSADRLREKLYDMAERLASLRGPLVMSFSVYDMAEERESFPSSLILQAFRLINRNETLDYSDLKESLSPAAGFIPPGGANALDLSEWWLARLFGQGRLWDGEEAVRKIYPILDRGLNARERRKGDRLTEFEGKIGSLPRSFNPLDNPELVLSASRLEMLAECPFKYYLQYILGLEPPDERPYDPSRWLDPMEKGSLLHEIYCEFMSVLRKKDEAPGMAGHAELIREIAESILERTRREIPPPAEVIYDKEKKEILDSLDIFLKLESERCGSRPLLFETAFGMPGEKGGPPSVEVPAGRGKTLYLRGIIDRIDRTDENAYRVIDYKTGGFNRYENLEKFGQGRILQHALYALAAREIIRSLKLGESPEIRESGYFFPTLKGEGREIYIPPPGPESVADVLRELTGWFEMGCFPVNPDARCHFCDFRMVCGDNPAGAAKVKKITDFEYYVIFDNLKNYK